ncbi:MAG: sugar phosphate isomerase/epimerase [Gemmatimonadetes bacterium]|jgi:sugar phosphate isomerase/epimerase|nr:sugar phosphate isomerase/epimerase [Gemmatimonadota bacterium]MBT7862249.1 sugar phosphate isomerase/epimerase [Gemmatimonadota bacterium]
MNREAFNLQYIVGSSLYGCLPLAQILPEVSRAHRGLIDIWPRAHGDQREQVEAMGHEAFAELLSAHGVKLGASTRFDLGPFGLQEEMKFANGFGASLLICGSKGPKDLKGGELRQAVGDFAEALRPHIDAAGEHDVTIAIENHGNALIESPDSMKWLVEFTDSPHLGIALAPYHLPDDAQQVAELITDLGSSLSLFYAWQHGMGCHEKLPKEQELMQLPGRGTLDFRPMLAALKKIDFSGWTEIFMHPVPRGIPILDTAAEVTDELERARIYLENLLKEL